MESNPPISRAEVPECIRLTVDGRIVAAHCLSCGAFIAAGQSVDMLETAIRMHPCVRCGEC